MPRHDTKSSFGVSHIVQYWQFSSTLNMSSFRHRPHRVPRVDKGLMILIYLACNVETRVDAQVLQAKLPGPVMNHSQFPLVEGLQVRLQCSELRELKVSLIVIFMDKVMCATACGCPDPDLRLIACRLIANFINMCEVDAQIFVFLELLDRPPFPAMRTASVGLLKDQVDASFNAVIRDRVKVISQNLGPA